MKVVQMWLMKIAGSVRIKILAKFAQIIVNKIKDSILNQANVSNATIQTVQDATMASQSVMNAKKATKFSYLQEIWSKFV